MLKKADSSMIKGYRYDEKTGNLHIQFSSGKQYVYVDVDKSVAEGLISAPSMGKFFSEHIRRGDYQYKIEKSEEIEEKKDGV